MRDYQYGFRRCRFTINVVHILRQITEKFHEHKTRLQIVYIDFKQVLDNLKREQIVQTRKRHENIRKASEIGRNDDENLTWN